MINNKLLETLYNLDNTFGVSGNEEETAAALRKEMEGLYDEHIENPLGSQIFIKYGKDRDRKIVLSAHMDEIGFILNYIEDNGIGRFLPVGYHDDRTAVNQDMVVMTESGKKVYGVTGSKPAHIMTEEDHEKVIKIEGGHPLHGTVTISGSKNATVALIPACVLANEPITIYGVPNISDVRSLIVLLRELGVNVEEKEEGTLYIDPTNMKNTPLISDAATKLRASYYFMGALFRKNTGMPKFVCQGDVI